MLAISKDYINMFIYRFKDDICKCDVCVSVVNIHQSFHRLRAEQMQQLWGQISTKHPAGTQFSLHVSVYVL